MSTNTPTDDDVIEGVMNSLEFCGCGRPEPVIKYFRDALRLLHDWNERPQITPDSHRIAFEEYQKKVLALHGSEGAAYFFYYWLDQRGLTEHGGSVPGWLTVDGKDFLDLLNTIKLESDA